MRVLLIVDVQNDFCPGGTLAVPGGDQIIPVINRISQNFGHIVQTQDWHPEKHHSFASAHEGKEAFDTIRVDYGDQVLWPDHCIRGTKGADFHPDLVTSRTEVIIRKGFRKEIDSYSSFYENDHQTRTGLTGYLNDRGLSELYVCGLATDFCVKWSVLDGLKEGFSVTVVEDAVKGIDIDGSEEQAWTEMKSAGAEMVMSDKLT